MNFRYHLTTSFLGAVLAISFASFVNRMAPVTVFMDVSKWERDRSYIAAQIEGYKIRDCQVVKDSFVGWVFARGVWHETPFEFMNDTSPNSSKPSSWFDKQAFGVWKWDTPPRDGKKIKMTMQHDCGGAIRTSSFGPFEYFVMSHGE